MAGVAVMAVLNLLVFGAAEAWVRRGRPPREWPRKAVHIGCGLLSLLLPRFVPSPWAVAVLAAAFTSFCLVGGRRGWLRCIGSDRPSLGGELYPIAVFPLLLRRATWLYVASIVTWPRRTRARPDRYAVRKQPQAPMSRSLRAPPSSWRWLFCMFMPMWRLGGGAARSALAAGLGAVLATAIRRFARLRQPPGPGRRLRRLPWLATLWPGEPSLSGERR